jgi:hypothetical protein
MKKAAPEWSGLKVELLPAMGAGLACVVVTVLGGFGYLLICSTDTCSSVERASFYCKSIPDWNFRLQDAQRSDPTRFVLPRKTNRYI